MITNDRRREWYFRALKHFVEIGNGFYQVGTWGQVYVRFLGELIVLHQMDGIKTFVSICWKHKELNNPRHFALKILSDWEKAA